MIALVEKFFSEKGIPTERWPRKTPDLNPIWDMMAELPKEGIFGTKATLLLPVRVGTGFVLYQNESSTLLNVTVGKLPFVGHDNHSRAVPMMLLGKNRGKNGGCGAPALQNRVYQQ